MSGSEIQGIRIYECPAVGRPLCRPQDAVDLIGDAVAENAQIVIVPVERLDPAFFQLRTGLAGEMLQKFVTYRLQVAIVGDLRELALSGWLCATSFANQIEAVQCGSSEIVRNWRSASKELLSFSVFSLQKRA
jgi:Domain of unknown function (DUF4180)